MSTPIDWDNAPSSPGDPILHAHKLGYHDVPEDDCPACRVDRGAALLDERRPGWWEDVDVERLDLRNPCLCVVPQSLGTNYSDGIDALRVGRDFGLPAYMYGFDIDLSDITDDYPTLTELWRSKISERRAR